MNLPILSQHIYGVFTLYGLYSFEFVDKNRNTITEIFFMIPPKTKNISEGTRSTVMPTLGGNYLTDGGNSTKKITLTGDLYFPYIGSPYNPVAPNNVGLEGTIDGMTEFFKLRWMLIRYRDYTMSRNSKMNIPIIPMSESPEIIVLYRKIARNMVRKLGGLYDEIKLIFHDYDMDDHFFCKISNFSGNQTDSKYIAVEYSIELECYEPDTMQKIIPVIQIKQSSNDSVNTINSQIQNLNFNDKFAAIQIAISYNTDFVSATVDIQNTINNINTENEKIQAGQSTVLTEIPIYTAALATNTANLLIDFISTFLSDANQILYFAGTLTIDEVVSLELFSFYNLIQKLKIYADSLQGVINSIVKQDEIRYYANADDYTLTTEQFDSADENIVENNTTFYFYEVTDGDTARTVALHELKDANKFVSILKINQISENDFIDGTLIGQKIKIPIDISAVSRSDENLVYESNQNDIQKFLYGSDIATDINDRLLISPKGDLRVTDGIENAYNSVLKRMTNRKGSLNVFNPNWGTVAIDESNAPFLVKIDRYLTDLISQMQEDPRVESAKMDLKKIKIDGETITTQSTIYFIGEENREVVI